MFDECLTSQAHGFSNSFSGDAAAPFFNDGFPCHTTGHLFQHLRDHYPSAAKGRLTMTDLSVSDNISAYQFRIHLRSTLMFDEHIMGSAQTVPPSLYRNIR